jgi:hypothetical protein
MNTIILTYLSALNLFRGATSLSSNAQRTTRRFLAALAVLTAAGTIAQAQLPEVLPQADVYLRIKPSFQVYFQVEGEREDGNPVQMTLGPTAQFYLKPLVKLKKITYFDLDDAKRRPFVIETGYRNIVHPGEADENRWENVATFHLPIFASILLSDGNTVDRNWQGGVSTWKYTQKVTLERTFAIGHFRFIPGTEVSTDYQSQYSKFSSTSVEAKCNFPITRSIQLSADWEHQNNTGKDPNKQINNVGLGVHFYLSIVHDKTGIKERSKKGADPTKTD